VSSRVLMPVAVGGALVLLGVLAFAASSKPAEQESSIAKRVTDAVATRDPAVMRALAAELEETGNRDAAEGLRMAADLTEQTRGASP
jgi:hypothetical protein